MISVTTKKASDFAGTEASGAAGSSRTLKGRLSYGMISATMPTVLSQRQDSTARGRTISSTKNTTPPEDNNGVAVNADYERNQTFFGKAGYGEFTVESAFVSRMKGIPTSSFGADFNDRNNRTIDQRYYLDLKYEHRLDVDATVTARLFYDAVSLWGTYVYSGVRNKDYADGQSVRRRSYVQYQAFRYPQDNDWLRLPV